MRELNAFAAILLIVIGLTASGCTGEVESNSSDVPPPSTTSQKRVVHAAPPLGSEWELMGGDPSGTLMVDAATVSGKDGCNFYQASWSAPGGGVQVRFSDFSGTTVGCPGRVNAALVDAKSWFVIEDKLFLHGRRNERLAVFQRVIDEDYAAGGSR